jgi:hypothetical protein
MAAQEAHMRLHGVPIVRMKHKVKQLIVHEPDGQNVLLDDDEPVTTDTLLTAENSVTMLTGFFKLCEQSKEARAFTYEEIPLHYTYSLYLLIWIIITDTFSWQQKGKDSCWKKRKRPLNPDPAKRKFLYRLYSASPKKVELFSIRYPLPARL